MSNRTINTALACLAVLAALSFGGFSPAQANALVIQIPQPGSEEERAEAIVRERRWVERCRPVVRHDEHGVPRYIYAAPSCGLVQRN